VDGKSFSSLVFVEIANDPLTVSGANTIFQILSPSKFPSGKTLSTVAEAYSYSSDGSCTILDPIKDFGSPETTFTFKA